MKSAGSAVGAGERGGEAAHALEHVGRHRARHGRLDLEQVAEDDEVVDGAALVVAAVGEHLLRQLALEQLDAALEQPRRRRRQCRRARARARCGSRGCRGCRPRRCARDEQLPPEALAHAAFPARGSSESAAIQFPARVEIVYGCQASLGRAGMRSIQSVARGRRPARRPPGRRRARPRRSARGRRAGVPCRRRRAAATRMPATARARPGLERTKRRRRSGAEPATAQRPERARPQLARPRGAEAVTKRRLHRSASS